MKKHSSFGGVFTAVFLAVFFCGCAVTEIPETPEERATLSLSRIENRIAGPDPCEPFNRAMFSVTDFCMVYLADPVGRVYCTILPRPVIECIDNACNNLEYPARAISSLCRAEWKGAGDETIRFLVNTTVGIAGLFDPAKHWLHIYSTNSGFGQAFAKWGVPSGCIFVLPFSSAANVRDTAGLLFDMVFDCKTYIPYCGWATFLNRTVVAQDRYSAAFSGALDPYKGFVEYSILQGELDRQLWSYRMQNRLRDRMRELAKEQQTSKPELPPLPPEKPVSVPGHASVSGCRWVELPRYHSIDPVTDSLRSVFFREQQRGDFWYMPLSLFCDDFVCRRSEFSVRCFDNKKMQYAFWKSPADSKAQQKKEQLVIILPGIGGTYMNSSPVAFAELFNMRGANVAVINSTFSWQYNSSESARRIPGYLPDDAESVRSAIVKVLADLRERKKITSPEITLMGYSFGAMHTLKIAQLEEEKSLIGAARFVAVNPPVSLDNAIAAADSLVASGAGLSDKEIKGDFIDAAGQIMFSSSRKLPPYDGVSSPHNYRIDVPNKVSRVLVGLNLKNSMRELLLSAHKKSPLQGLKQPADTVRKNNLYLEIDRVTFRYYAEKILSPGYPDIPIAQLYKNSDLRSMENTLKLNEKIFVLHNIDDFLLTEQDKAFLSTTLKNRLTWFNHGGHLGNLHTTHFQHLLRSVVLSE